MSSPKKTAKTSSKTPTAKKSAKPRAIKTPADAAAYDAEVEQYRAETREHFAAIGAEYIEAEPPEPTLSNEQLNAGLRALVVLLVDRSELRYDPKDANCGGEVPMQLDTAFVYPPVWPSNISKKAARFTIEAMKGQSAAVREQLHPFARAVLESVPDALADLALVMDPAEIQTNTLSALGNLVSKTLRRRVLLRELEAADWVLSTVSERLRMGGSNNVTKAIAQLGLDAELKAARRAGKARQGRRGTVETKDS